MFRFGVDRALLMLGRGLAARGHRVAVMANRLDSEVVATFASEVIVVPEGGNGYINLDDFAAKWIETHWGGLFSQHEPPQVAIIGGWPFFAAIPVLERLGCRTVFMDCGAVPLAGFEGGAVVVQERVRQLRREFLPKVTLITPISCFIANSQSIPDGAGAEVTPVLLGADHLREGVWRAGRIAHGRPDPVAGKARNLADEGRPVIINLGRWEPGCYKNSEAAFEIADLLRRAGIEFALAILGDPETTNIPDRLKGCVLPIGYPDDDELQRWMEAALVGISVSRWEGFNLPLVEMQWLNRPVLALDVGAHPEVILHPWFLCRNEEEMAEKIITLLAGCAPVRGQIPEALRRFQAAFRWDSVVDRYEVILARLARRGSSRRVRLMIDVSNASRDDANSGVVRVTRRLARELQEHCEITFAIWHAEHETYVFPNDREYARLAAFNGPLVRKDMPRSPGGSHVPVLERLVEATNKPEWLLITETVLETNGRAIRAFALGHGLRVGAVFYDAIPVLRPDLVMDEAIRSNHAGYMEGLGACDLVMPISTFSSECLQQFWSDRNIAGARVATVQLPGEFAGAARCVETEAETRAVVSILCVSTLEPRKNHMALLRAMRLLSQRHPGVQWTLTLIGNRYAGGEEIERRVVEECERDPRIRWLGVVDDAALHRAYEECTFTVYASELEGFGMPILESIWHGKPCICHRRGVMAELAAGGGCHTVDVNNIDALADAIAGLARDVAVRARLASEAVRRPIRLWNEYAGDILKAIASMDDPSPHRARAAASQENSIAAAEERPTCIVDLLYPGCLTRDWQMNDSERLAMTAVLHRLKPTCAIEIGTYKGGSLSLLAQYASVVFSIDIDPTIPEKFSQFNNVSFFTGPSGDVLPALLQALIAVDLPVEFILIDGDHSAAGVQRDIESVLDYVPRKPLVVMLHDGFNPECRRGMMSADWGRSPFVQWIDLDFVPGRVVEHGGAGDGGMWGGLALALIDPVPRKGSLVIGQSAGRAFEQQRRRQHSL